MEAYKYTYAYNFLGSTQNATFMSVVAFYGNGANAVISAPRYMRSTNRTLTVGAGRASQLFLIIRLSAGNPKYLQWFSLGCGDCGVAADLCMSVGDGDRTCGRSEAREPPLVCLISPSQNLRRLAPTVASLALFRLGPFHRCSDALAA